MFSQGFFPKLGFWLVLALVASGVFVAGVSWGRHSGITIVDIPDVEGRVINQDALPPKDLVSQDLDFSLFWNVWNIVKSKYVTQPVSEQQLFYGSLKGLVGGLDDPHSVFLDPKLMAKYTECG